MKTNEVNKVIPSVGYTHGASFHADDVFGAALLRIINPNIVIHRVLEVPSDIEADAIVFDIGGGRFDHHQVDAEFRENGKKYAAFGLLWREFGPMLVSESNVHMFDEMFIQSMDSSDNFGTNDTICGLIDAFNPNWDEVNANVDAKFECAVAWAKTILSKYIEKMQAAERAEATVQEAVDASNDNIVVLEQGMPWNKIVVATDDKQFVVYPSSRGGWNAQVVPIDSTTLKARKDFPSAWGGLRNEELVSVSGINGLVFCHSALFMVAAETREAAIEACKFASKN